MSETRSRFIIKDGQLFIEDQMRRLYASRKMEPAKYGLRSVEQGPRSSRKVRRS
jgi:hypothetical protein